jgi:hypothetical protein
MGNEISGLVRCDYCHKMRRRQGGVVVALHAAADGSHITYCWDEACYHAYRAEHPFPAWLKSVPAKDYTNSR